MFFAPSLVSRRVDSFSPSFRVADQSVQRFLRDAYTNADKNYEFAQDDTSWTLSLDVPGLSREDISVDIEVDVVRIKSKDEAKRKVRASYRLPQEIDASASEARVENGVLTIKLAKKAPVNNVTQLTVN